MASRFKIRDRLKNLAQPSASPGGVGTTGSPTSQALQAELGTGAQAFGFYKNRVHDHLKPWMSEYIATADVVFVASVAANGDLDCSSKFGHPGFVRVLDTKTIAIPLYSGNGVHATLGNVVDNPKVGLCFWKPHAEVVSLQLNGGVTIVEASDEAARRFPAIEEDEGRSAVRWMVVEVHESYMRCARHTSLIEGREEEVAP
ncbi:MAG: pyridoxamine 5-phosphate oxidase [Proteobacteria bacterium]|nr:pyridoxamine 5-phosphate oxidase [Pseudomonadota bacterium]